MAVKPGREWLKMARWKECQVVQEAHPSAREIAKTSQFQDRCLELDVKPSVRQARDYRRKIGRFAK